MAAWASRSSAAASVTVAQCSLVGNAKAGLFDMNDAHATTLSGSIVTGNGHDGQKYDGDGVELDSSGALVTGNRITGNGDSVGFEHGIYAGSAARDYTIAGNSIWGNAGADIKAAGGPALVTGNRLRSSLFGVVVSDNPKVVTVQYNLIQGRFQHGILVTTGRHSPARARFWNNTVEQTGRLTGSGNASAVFVVSAGLLALRNNLLAYTNPDGLGQAIMINGSALVGSFTASTNWYANTDPAKRRLAWNGSLVTLGAVAAALRSGRHDHRLGGAPLRPRRPCPLTQPGRRPRPTRSGSRATTQVPASVAARGRTSAPTSGAPEGRRPGPRNGAARKGTAPCARMGGVRSVPAG